MCVYIAIITGIDSCAQMPYTCVAIAYPVCTSWSRFTWGYWPVICCGQNLYSCIIWFLHIFCMQSPFSGAWARLSPVTHYRFLFPEAMDVLTSNRFLAELFHVNGWWEESCHGGTLDFLMNDAPPWPWIFYIEAKDQHLICTPYGQKSQRLDPDFLAWPCMCRKWGGRYDLPCGVRCVIRKEKA